MSFMPGRQFVDTNILVYAHDRSAGEKHEIAKTLIEHLWRTRSGVLSTQVLQEVCVNLRRKAGRPLSAAATRELITDYLSWHLIVNDGSAVLTALELEEKLQKSFWDALILCAAQTAGADILYSEDFEHGRTYGSVRAVNPFIGE